MLGNIVIVGDQNKQGQELREALKKNTHFAVSLVPVNKVSELIIQKDPDLIILNPKNTYLEIMDIYYGFKKDPRLQDVPITLLLDENEMKNADLPSGIHEVLFRPLRVSEAVVRVRHLLKRSQKVDQKDLIQRGKLAIDVTKYEVRVNDRKIDLTFTEFELLKFLCANPDTVFTREVLLNKVWGYEYYGGTRTVDVHIRRLRSKIEDKSSTFIETVRNIGYKFISQR